MPDGGVALALWRGVAVAGLLSALGSVLFCWRVLPAGMTGAALDRTLRRVTGISLGVACLGLGVWLVLLARYLAETSMMAATLAAVPDVLLSTRAGWITAGEMGCLLGAAAMGRRRGGAALALLAGAVGLHVLRTHAGTSGRPLLLGSELAHVAASGVWLGGLMPLLLTVWALPPHTAAVVARRFSVAGSAAVATLVGTAGVQFWILVGGLPGLVGTQYGRVVLLKLGLFGVLLACAGLNRQRLTPALAGDFSARGRNLLLTSIAIESLGALALVLAAGWLGQLTPAAHAQPVWPFAWRLSLVTVRADTGFMAEAVGGGVAVLLGGVLVAASAWLRGVRRWVALAGGVVLAVVGVPHLSVLRVPANPDSFLISPTGFAASAIVRGAALYPQHCAGCHGSTGRGDGAAGAQLAVPPADLTAAHLWEHSDGDLFWWLAAGMRAPGGALVMPGFASVLTDADRWALIDFVRAHNAGGAIAGGWWTVAVAAPGVGIVCQDTPAALGDLRGRPVRLAIGGARPQPGAGVRTVWVDPRAVPSAGMCATADPAAMAAFGWVTGLGDRVSGAEVLVDAEGLLRAVRPRGDLATFGAPLRELARRGRLAAPTGMMPGMRM